MIRNPLTLLVPEKSDDERDAVADAWHSKYGDVLRVGRFWDPPNVDRENVCLYGGTTFWLVLAQLLKLNLVTPPDDLILSIDSKWLKRKLSQVKLNEIDQFPVFAKPLIPKQFAAAIYESAHNLDLTTAGLDRDTAIIISEVVELTCEVRVFVLDGKAMTASVYEGIGNVQAAQEFVGEFAKSLRLPRTLVVDVGQTKSGEWIVIETNATWGSGLNGCDPTLVCDCIMYATEP